MQRKLTFHDMSGTGTKKIFRLQMSYTNEISNGDPVIKMKALNILKVHNYLFRAHKKVSLLTNRLILKNYCRDLKKID